MSRERPDPNGNVLARFEAFRLAEPDLDYAGLAARLGVVAGREVPLAFDPTGLEYFDETARALQLTPEELAVFRRHGVVSIDHDQRYSMGSAYYAIYTRDLPVFVSSDSVLHALHRSFDQGMSELEEAVLLPALANVLGRTAQAITRARPSASTPALRQSLEDVDLYFSVAWNLLAGAGAPEDEAATSSGSAKAARAPARVLIPPGVVAEERVADVLSKIASLELQAPGRGSPTSIYGGARYVDFSQFRVRGHYTRSAPLRRLFRALSWLGRADTGWTLRAPDPATRRHTDPIRERRNALLAVLLLEQSGELSSLEELRQLMDFVLGRSDNVGVPEVQAALRRANLDKLEQLAADDAGARFERALDEARPREQQIRSQVLGSKRANQTPTPLPLEFQIFGQRFSLDSFLLSRVVYDSIVYRGEKIERFSPSGLDVMAALGNDEAVRVLEPELEKYRYSSNLLAARRIVDATSDEEWERTAYNRWLSALRALDDEPGPGAAFPSVMRGAAWRRKQLRTALASWSELRHDTVLHAKQSYTSSTMCEYPAGFVEPYPEFFARVASLTEALASGIRALDVPALAPNAALRATRTRDGLAAFFANFAETARRLERLARLELSSKPFDDADQEFLKKTIDVRGGGSGMPRYDGWYPRLVYGRNPDGYLPVVADVHTDPNHGEVLEEGVGDVQFLLVAVDNGPHRRVYVGPAYSHYEFRTKAQRLTDEEWEARLRAGQAPAPPAFTRVFAPKATKRVLAR